MVEVVLCCGVVSPVGLGFGDHLIEERGCPRGKEPLFEGSRLVGSGLPGSAFMYLKGGETKLAARTDDLGIWAELVSKVFDARAGA